MITEKRLNRQAVVMLLVLVGVLAYTTFQWGGVVRTGAGRAARVEGILERQGVDQSLVVSVELLQRSVAIRVEGYDIELV